MPCLNEARTVGRCIDKAWQGLRAAGAPGEVVIADNGSTDDSAAIAEAHGARVVRVAEPGYGNAVRGGVAAARGRYVVIGDADDSYDFAELEPFVQRLRAGDDLVMGNRFQGGIRPGAMPWLHRYVGNPLLTGLLNLFFRTPVGDAHCGLRAVRKATFDRLGLSAPGMEFASEMVVKASLHGCKMAEVPVVLHPDGRDRPPHLRTFRDGWRHLHFLLLMCPGWLYLAPAASLLAFGFALLVWLSAGPRPVGSVVLDVHTMLVGSVCLILGYQALWLWMFARLYGVVSGVLAAPGSPPGALLSFFLRHGPLTGALLVLVGLGLHGWLLREWWGQGLGALDARVTLRPAIWGLTAMVFGAQTVFGSFFAHLLTMTARACPAPGEAS